MRGEATAHRNDIDGLRAVAVLPIVLFHAGLTRMSGGFVGVDIFFVISGYLITGIIVRDTSFARFSLLEFYRRRIVRIVPALTVMLAATLATGVLVMLPRELERLAESSAAAAAFASNIYFWKTTDYFAGSAETMPLLHTWSLGVEEQFYLFYPLGILAIRRIAPRLLIPALVIAGMLSFAADIRWSLNGSVTGFYLLPGRIWELVLGGLVSLVGPVGLRRRAREILALSGMILIAAGLMLIRSDSMFPAPTALLPCGGAALILACGEGTFSGRLLSLKPLCWIGLISYSLYLWHWPIMAFMRLYWGVHLSPALMVAAFAASVAAGAISYYVVETPSRKAAGRFRSGRTVLAGLMALAVVCAASLAVARHSTAIVRLDPEVASVAAHGDYYRTPAYVAQQRPHACFATFDDQRYDPKLCLSAAPDRANILLVGDSHAAQYWLPLARRYPRANIMQATSSGCLPQFAPEGAGWCVPVIRRALDLAERRQGVDGIILAGRWTTGQLDALTATVHRLAAAGMPVMVIGPINEYDGDFPEILARAMMRSDLSRISTMRLTGPVALDRMMAPRIRQAGGQYYSVIEQECPRERCRLFASDGTPFHTDYGHVAERAAEDLLANLPTSWPGHQARRYVNR